MKNKYSDSLLKRVIATLIGSVVALFFAAAAFAADTTVFVDGRSGPWDITVNPSYIYGYSTNINLQPTSVNSASGLSFAAGNTLTIEYVTGLAYAGVPGEHTDANGINWFWLEYQDDAIAPGAYIADDNFLEQALGVFANSAGEIVGSPFTVGNGPTLAVIPSGATQLLLGFNDVWYGDNGDGLYMKVTGLAVPTLSAITVTPANPTINIGQTQQFTATGTFSDGTSHVLNTWAGKASMPNTRAIHAMGVVNGILYAVGGFNGNYLATMEAYDPATDIWTPKASMSTPRTGLAVGVVNGILYAVGGYNVSSGSRGLATVEAYDPATNTWTPKASMSSPHSDHAVGVVNGILYAVGGLNNSGVLSTMEAYDPATNTWTPKASMSSPRWSPAVGVVNGTLYAVGGYGLSTVEAYDPATNIWTPKASMSTPRWGPSVGVANNMLYATGGNNGSSVLATVEAYDPATNTWMPKASMSNAHYVHTMGVANGTLYAVGGLGSSGYLATVEAYIPSDGVIWSSNNTSVGTIDIDGLASGLSPGVTTITATSSSISGNTTLAVVNPNRPPVAYAGPDQTVTVTGAATAVTLNGSGSSDPDSDALTYTWSGAFGTATGINPSIALPLGTHTITLTVSDGQLSATDTVVIKVTYGFGGFLPPLTADSRTTFHLGSIIPVKFDLYDASGAAISTAVARLSVQKLFNGEPIGAAIDATPTSGADSGNLFRYNGGHYAYNLSTKPFSAGIWRIQATLNDGTVRTIDIGLTSK